MSRDIRSFFVVKNEKIDQQKTDQSTKKTVQKLGQKKRPIIIDSDSDEESSPVNTKRSKPSVGAKKLNNYKKPEVPETKSKYFESHCVSITDIFDKTPVKRDTSRKIIKRIVTKEVEESHLDKDFEDELAKLDFTWDDPYNCKGEGNKVEEENHIKKENYMNCFKESPKKTDAAVGKESHFDKDFVAELVMLDYTLPDIIGEENKVKEENNMNDIKESPKKTDAGVAKYNNRKSPLKKKSDVDYNESPSKKFKLEDKEDVFATKEDKNKDNKQPTLNGCRKDSPIKNVESKVSSSQLILSPSKSSLLNKYPSNKKTPEKTPEKSPHKRDLQIKNAVSKISPFKKSPSISSLLDKAPSIKGKLKTPEKSPYKKDPQINTVESKISSFKKSPSKYALSHKAPSIKGKLKTPEKSPYKKLSLTIGRKENFKNEENKLSCDILHAKNSDAFKTEVTSNTPLSKESPKERVVEKCLPNKINDRYKKNKDSTANEISDRTEKKKGSTKNEIGDKTEVKGLSPTLKVEGKPATITPVPSNLWVERYKPTATKQIIGQQGEKSCVNKLITWLNNWEKNHSGTKKLVKPSPWAKNDDGAFFKAALLSGPPGVGKTTTAHLVCKELGFDIVEFNASDTRSKRLLHEEVSELLSTKSLSPYFTGKGDQVTKKHVLLMDEVDGMAGNEDRGGVQELISLIKQSRVPVVCMCNDRNHPKIRSLANYCFDLRFSKPRVEQIRGAMMSVCFKEKLKLKPDELADIITSANQDIRLIMNHLSMLSVEKTSMANSTKHIKLGPWDIVRKIFSEQDHKSMSIHDKCDLFFHDYSVTPLFVQENYLNAVPHKPEAKNRIKKMELFAKAATSLSFGDLTEKSIRSNNAWGLLPVQAVFSSLVPGAVLEGHLGAQISFPAWFGKNSRQTKMSRLVQELTVHSRLKISGNREAMNLDYLTSLGSAITSPLLHDGAEGVATALSVLSEYCLVREDMESIAELSTWPGCKNGFAEVESKVKAAFTRAYNKTCAPTPYAAVPVKKGRGDVDTSDGLAEEDEIGTQDMEDDEEDGLEADSMIMVKKKPAGKKVDKDVQPSTTKGSKTSKRGRKK